MVPAFTGPFDLFIIPHLWLKVLQLQTLSPYDLLLTPLACDGGSLRPWVGIHLHCFRYHRIGWFQAWDYAGIGCNYRSQFVNSKTECKLILWCPVKPAQVLDTCHGHANIHWSAACVHCLQPGITDSEDLLTGIIVQADKWPLGALRHLHSSCAVSLEWSPGLWGSFPALIMAGMRWGCVSLWAECCMPDTACWAQTAHCVARPLSGAHPMSLSWYFPMFPNWPATSWVTMKLVKVL